MKLYKDFKTEQARIRQEEVDKELLQKEVVIIYEQRSDFYKIKGVVFALLLMALVGIGICFLITKGW